MSTNSSIHELFAKYLNGETSIEETKALFERIAADENEVAMVSLLESEFEETVDATEYDPQWDLTLQKIKSQIAVLDQDAGASAQLSAISAHLRQSTDELTELIPDSRTGKSILLWSRIAGVAAVILVVFGLYLSISPKHKADYNHLTSNDIAPGKMGATLTLANGKKISLSDAANGEIAKESGLSITKTTDGQLVYQVQATEGKSNTQNTLSTAIGETYILRLPDQTKVWLNASSSLTYSPALTVNGVRRVKLSGEGYFEVAKDKEHPFIVESGTQSVQVLGTHFNVNAYRDENAYRTTLLEGSVRIDDQGNTQLLEPGNQATNAAGKISLTAVDTEFAVAWTSNNFVFDRLDIKEIMKMIARWYKVDIIYKEEIPANTFWGSVSRFDNISKVLIPLEATGNVHFKIEGRKIYVSR